MSPDATESIENEETDTEKKKYVVELLKKLEQLSLKNLRNECDKNGIYNKGTSKQLKKRIKTIMYKKYPELSPKLVEKIKETIKTPFDYFVVIDFECNCKESDKDNVELRSQIHPIIHEIIEFPAVIIDVKKNEIIGEFRKFIKPKFNPILSNFCKQLTGITQDEINKADTFPVVLEQFQNFLKEFGLNDDDGNYIIVNDDVNDMANFLQTALQSYNLEFPHNFRTFIQIRELFYENFDVGKEVRYMPLYKLIEYTGDEFEGRPHCGIDDTRNIAKLCMFMIEKEISILPTHKLVKLPLINKHYGRNLHYKPRRRIDYWYNRHNYGLVLLRVKHVVKQKYLRCESCNFRLVMNEKE